MANNKGGNIVFGVKDSPHIPMGLKDNRFSEIDPKDIDKRIREFFSSEIMWTSEMFEYDNNSFGILHVEPSDKKPVICKKNHVDILREGAIYYRYRGETKEIEYAELNRILDNERNKERALWMNLISKISHIGPENVQLLDTYNGELVTDKGRILIDEKIIDNIKFIKEGQFVEKNGAPALKLIGEISSTSTVPSDKIYRLLFSDLSKACRLNKFELNAVIYKLKLKDNVKYHTSIKSGKNNIIHKYTEAALSAVLEFISSDGNLARCVDEYKIVNKQKYKTRKR